MERKGDGGLRVQNELLQLFEGFLRFEFISNLRWVLKVGFRNKQMEHAWVNFYENLKFENVSFDYF